MKAFGVLKNARLKKAMAKLTIDITILKEVGEGNLKPDATTTGGRSGPLGAPVLRAPHLSGVGHPAIQYPFTYRSLDATRGSSGRRLVLSSHSMG